VVACSCFSCRRCGGCQAAGLDRLCLCAEEAASGNITGGSPGGRDASRHDMDGAVMCASVAILLAQSTRPRRDVWTFISGRLPRMSWYDGRGLRLVILCSLGYRLTVRAVLQLESERWYVGVVVLVVCAGRTRAAESRSDVFESLITLMMFGLVSCGRWVTLDIGCSMSDTTTYRAVVCGCRILRLC
jgi:hypothetical protein